MGEAMTLRVELTGTAPLLVHNARLANPLDHYTKEIKKVTSKRTKTEEDHWKIAELEFLGGLYFDEKLGPFLPGVNLRKMIQEAAKSQKKGKTVVRAVQIQDQKNPIQYKGPRNPEKMWESGKFHDMRSLKVQQNRVTRTRPIFEAGWKIEFTVVYHTDLVEKEDIISFLEYASKFEGLGEHRPDYGTFTFEIKD